MTVLLYSPGILWNSKDQPIRDGFLLAHALCAGQRVIVATDGSRERMDHQLRTERLQDMIADVVDETYALPPQPLWRRQLEVVRSRFPVTLVVAAIPDVIEHVVENGLVGLFFYHPGFGMPVQRPEVGNRSWEKIVGEMESRL